MLERIRADRRWDEVVTLRILEGRPGGDAPLSRIGPGRVSAMIRAAIPGAVITVVDLPEGELADAVAGMHARIAGRGGLGRDEVLLADCGPHLALAYSHRHGDGPTMRALLAPLYHHLRGGPGSPAGRPLRRSRFPLPTLIGVAARRGLRRPAGAVAAARALLRERRTAPAVPDGGLVPAVARYRVTDWIHVGPGRPPRGLHLAAAWREALDGALEEGVLHPRDTWVNVGLRRSDPRLADLAGNFVTRIRLASGADPDVAAAATHRIVISDLPLLRAGASGLVQLLRQLPRPTVVEPVVPAIAGTGPSRGLAVSWSHNRVDAAGFGEVACTLAPPGGIAVLAYQCGDRLRILLSCHVADDLGATIEETTAGLLRAAGYREEPGG
ncbi:hypothetical protein [Corynebacterium sphenisci]|uniref:hypothetical protein n=1 Tax=Corynebacterium sphenisci TaxID=191493 RepID=UPI0012F4BDF0|nr:hypothetical protein [Corynebacterium sphenisci]